MTTKPRNPWQKIMNAYEDPRGVRGVRLSADDVMLLGGDGAIEQRAVVCMEEECEDDGHPIARGRESCRCGVQLRAARDSDSRGVANGNR